MEVVDNRQEGIIGKINGNRLVKKLKGIKNLQLLAAVFIIAVALLIYSGVGAKRNQEPVATSSVTMDSEEERLASILSGIEGAGKVETMITRRGDDIVGILVIAEGADNISVMLKLLTAATTAMGVDKSVVEVYSMK